MKTLIFTFIVLAATMVVRGDDKEKANHMKILAECADEFGLGEQDIEDMKTKLNFDDSKTTCFFACVSKKAGAMIGGKLDMDKTVELKMKHANVDKDKIIACVNEANAQTGECEIMGAMAKCMMK